MQNINKFKTKKNSTKIKNLYFHYALDLQLVLCLRASNKQENAIGACNFNSSNLMDIFQKEANFIFRFHILAKINMIQADVQG